MQHSCTDKLRHNGLLAVPPTSCSRFAPQRLQPSLKEPRKRPWRQNCRTERAARGDVPDEVLLQEVLSRIKSSDGGSRLAEVDQAGINDLLIELEKRGQHQQPPPLENPDIFGNFEVAYSSTQRAPKQEGQPAGGRFRSGIGKKIFQTTRLCQSVLQPDIVTNKVEFKLCGILRGSVGLRGKLKVVGDDKATVKVWFEPPRLTLGSSIDLQIGPTSSVVLTTTYLTPSVRLGKGSRGSLFVFTKGGAANAADMERVGLGRTTPQGWLCLGAVLLVLCASACGLWRWSLPGKVAAVFLAVVALLLGRAAVVDALQSKPAPQPS